MEPEIKPKSGRNLIAGIGIGVLTVLGLAVSASDTTTTTKAPVSSQVSAQQIQQIVDYSATQTAEPSASAPDVKKEVTQPQSGLSNDNYYKNVNGNTVHSPAYSNDATIPAGATAQCGDGTYSFSQNHRGTCSHHGGVSEWL